MFNTRKGLLLLYGIIWILVLISTYFRFMQDLSESSWERMVGDWINLFFLFLAFLINAFVLVPRLLFCNKRSQYLLMVILMIVVVAIFNILLHPPIVLPPEQAFEFHTPDFPKGITSTPSLLLGTILNNFITALLIIGSSTALELEYKWVSEQKLRKDAEKEQLITSLALLRQQVSPHFLMNTLNNIHSLVELDRIKAQEAIERLSTLMRYLLYHSAQNVIELKKEIEFVNSFFSLMQLRHSEEVEVLVLVPEPIPDVRIPPMLFIPLLENAYKHGVSYPLKSYIHFEILLSATSLNCSIKNSQHNKGARSHPGEFSGIGLENIKKSLKLLYINNYRLEIRDNEKEFEVNLTIPI